jgi:vacuolar iron transporter family protein
MRRVMIRSVFGRGGLHQCGIRRIDTRREGRCAIGDEVDPQQLCRQQRQHDDLACAASPWGGLIMPTRPANTRSRSIWSSSSTSLAVSVLLEARDAMPGVRNARPASASFALRISVRRISVKGCHADCLYSAAMSITLYHVCVGNPMEVRERHRSGRIGWLRAAVLGANDGIVSTASLVLGVAAAASNRQEILVAGIAGLAAGALSMAAGEYVSVSSQADTERADLTLERAELAAQPQDEEDELAAIYVQRGVEPDVARIVARQMMAKDALGAHSRDELGLSQQMAARPLQAALASAATFAVGAALPLLTIVLTPTSRLALTVSVVSLLSLAALGGGAAHLGGAPAAIGASRVAIWGALAMAATAAVGKLFGTAVG